MDIYPVKLVYDGQGNVIALSEYTAADTIPRNLFNLHALIDGGTCRDRFTHLMEHIDGGLIQDVYPVDSVKYDGGTIQ
jgi:hypothetical protein